MFPQNPKVDFSQFHALDHYPWQAECRDSYGGPRVHMKYWWEFKGSSRLHRYTSCLAGWHYKVTLTAFVPSASWPKTWRYKRPVCYYCMRPLGPTEYNPEVADDDNEEKS